MAARTHKIRVMIADDHAILRAGLKMLVNAQPDMEVISEAPDGEKAVQTAQETKPDVALLDLTMPGVGGMQALQQMACSCSETRVLVLTMHDDPAYLRSALAAGASGYLLKRAVDAELLAAIRAVHHGGTYVDPRLASVLVQDVLAKRDTRAGAKRPVKHPQRPRVAGAETGGAGLHQYANSERDFCGREDGRDLSCTFCGEAGTSDAQGCDSFCRANGPIDRRSIGE